MLIMKLFKPYLRVLIWLIIILTLEVLTGWVRANAAWIDIWMMFIKYFLLTLVILTKRRKDFIYYAISFHLLILFLCFLFLKNFLYHDSIDVVFWDNLLIAMLGFWIAFAFLKSNALWKKQLLMIFGLGIVTFVFINKKYIAHFNSFKTFSIANSIWVDPELYSIIDKNEELVVFEKNKLYILDFWYSGCGVCYEEFPSFEKKYLDNINSNIEYIAINHPIRDDKPEYFWKILEDRNYTFPAWKGSENMSEAFTVSLYPTIVVFRNDTILYKGHLQLLDKFLKTVN